MTEIGKYHELAKDAGNRLRAYYILSVSSGATGVFFLALTKQDKVALSCMEKWFLSLSLLAFVITVALCLYELRIDAQRFFCLAKELEKEEGARNWAKNEKYKRKRYLLIHASYVTLAVGVAFTFAYIILQIIR